MRAVFPHVEFTALRDQPQADFRGLNPDDFDCQSLAEIGAVITSEQADIGFVFDVDVGPFRVVDDAGYLFSKDEILWLFLQMLGPSLEKETFLYHRNGSVKIVEEGKRYGGEPKELVSALEEDIVLEMKRTKALIGFGPQGEIYYRGARGNRITFFAICWIMDYLAHLDCPLSLWRKRLPGDLAR